MKKIIIFCSDGEIGNFLSNNLVDTYDVVKASRNAGNPNYIDFSNRDSIKNFIKKNIDDKIYGIVNCYGIQKPINNFLDSNFEDWERNIIINFQNYSFFLHSLLNQNLPEFRKIVNFSGGGATGPRKGFSAYAISKISLYKLTEILAEELRSYKIDINIIAPGVIKSKMTKEIIDRGSDFDEEYLNALNVYKNGGNSKDNILSLCRLLLSRKSNGLSGKLISAQWDNFQEFNVDSLKNDYDLFNLRRIDNKFFTKKKDIQ
jgi:Dehydrogenases with different specificities (related to short-chain alcohol dehydrogenases)